MLARIKMTSGAVLQAAARGELERRIAWNGQPLMIPSGRGGMLVVVVRQLRMGGLAQHMTLRRPTFGLVVSAATE